MRDFRQILDFQDTLDVCGLVDLGASGPKFTWGGRVRGGGWVQERLDRVVVNQAWLQIFAKACVVNMATSSSDYLAISLRDLHLEGEQVQDKEATRGLFRNEKAWDKDPECAAVVDEA